MTHHNIPTPAPVLLVEPVEPVELVELVLLLLLLLLLLQVRLSAPVLLFRQPGG